MSSDSKPRSSWQPPSLAELQALLPAFEFHALIGRGGMGAVFKATQLSLNRPVAIKMLPTKLMEDADANFAARFRQEALTMAKLTHPGIVTVFESGEAGGLLYIVMEFVDGTDVARMIASEGKLAPELATRLLTQVCDALHYAHERGVIHRDIKPANLLLTRDGTVKIADFGLAKHDDATLQGLTKTNVAIGTPDFLAPEAWTPNTTLDGRADVYALGVTFYQMLTAEVPRGFWEMPSARVGTDKRFDAIIERALQPKPEARYQSSAELRRDLERIQAEPRSAEHRSTLREQPTSEPSDARRSTASPKMRRVAAALVALAVILMGVIAVLLWPRPPQQASSTALSGPRNWIVTTTNDFGRGSLREALILVENGETITFAAHLAGATILLEGGGIIVKKSIHIDASALPGGITLDGGGGHRVFEFVHCTNVLTGLTITNGNNLGHGAGGGLFNYFGHVTLNRCTLVGNRAFRGKLPEYAGGGGIFTYGTLILNQCTLAGNTSEQGGAIGVSRGGVAYLNHCTVVSNTATSDYGGGGISVRPGSRLILNHSIVAGNNASVDANIVGAYTQTGANLTNGDPRLAPLGRYGGPAPTMPPLPGSPAIDAAIGSTFTNDQRGFPRPVGAAADTGAVEADSIPNGRQTARVSHTATNAAAVREAAQWLVSIGADVRVESQGRGLNLQRVQDIPAGDFDIVSLWLDRWKSTQQSPTDKDFQRLRSVHTLRDVFVRVQSLSDEAFAFLGHNPHLVTVQIQGATGLTDGVFLQLAGLKRLKRLDLGVNRRLTGRGMAQSAWHGSIETLYLANTRVDDAAVQTLAACPRLVDVMLSDTRVSDQGLRALVGSRALQKLWLGACPNLTGPGLAETLPQFGAVNEISLPDTPCGDETAAAIATMTNVFHVDMSGTQLTDAGLAPLATMRQLRRLEVRRTGLTAAAIAAFEKANPNCSLER